MADLLSLIKLRKHTVEEKQKILSTLYREIENLQNKRKEMEDQLAREKELATTNNGAGAFYGLYAENMRKKIARMDDAIRKVNARIDLAQEEVRAAFAEQKKIEIIQRTREEEEEKALADKESQVMDDMAIEGFRRKKDE